MIQVFFRYSVALLLLTVTATATATAQNLTAAKGPSLIGIDHMPLVVSDLEQAVASYQAFGFSIKPGRSHDNGLRNSHVKFEDGSGIELIMPPAKPADELSRVYSDLLEQGEGPVYIAFHARNQEALVKALNNAELAFSAQQGLISLVKPSLEFIFFVKDNRSPSDMPEHFAHSNTAIAMTEVWLAVDSATQNDLRQLFLALGAVRYNQSVTLHAEAQAEVFRLQNGRVILVPERYQLRQNRPIIGVKFHLQREKKINSGTETLSEVIEPIAAYGLWLSFESSADH